MNHVRRVKPEDSIPVVIGSIFAVDGAWDRKYVMVGIRKLSRKEIQLDYSLSAPYGVEYSLQYIGRYFATGKVRLPMRKSKPVKAPVVTDGDGHIWNLSHFRHVIPVA